MQNANRQDEGKTEAWVRVADAAEYFRIGRTLLYVLMNNGTLPYLPTGRRGRRVKLSYVERALRERAEKIQQGS